MYRRQWIKTIPKKRKCKKAKGLSEEVLQTAEKKRQLSGDKFRVLPFSCMVHLYLQYLLNEYQILAFCIFVCYIK